MDVGKETNQALTLMGDNVDITTLGGIKGDMAHVQKANGQAATTTTGGPIELSGPRVSVKTWKKRARIGPTGRTEHVPEGGHNGRRKAEDVNEPGGQLLRQKKGKWVAAKNANKVGCEAAAIQQPHRSQ
jgi:hypothetical protein